MLSGLSVLAACVLVISTHSDQTELGLSNIHSPRFARAIKLAKESPVKESAGLSWLSWPDCLSLDILCQILGIFWMSFLKYIWLIMHCFIARWIREQRNACQLWHSCEVSRTLRFSYLYCHFRKYRTTHNGFSLSLRNPSLHIISSCSPSQIGRKKVVRYEIWKIWKWWWWRFKSSVVTPCRLVNRYRRVGGACCLRP